MNLKIWSSLPLALLATVLGTVSFRYAQPTKAVDQDSSVKIIPAQKRHKPVRDLPFGTLYPVTDERIALIAASKESSVQPTDARQMRSRTAEISDR